MRRNALACLVVFGFVVSTTLIFSPRICLGFDLGGNDGKKLVKDIFGITTPKKKASLNGTYKVNKRSYTEPDVKVVQVNVTNDQTVLRFRYHNTYKKAVMTFVRPAGHKGAFYIVPTNGKKKFHIIDSNGIVTTGGKESTKIPSGSTLEFTVSFERIDDSMTRFHLMEGNTKNAWHFMNINLGAPKPGDDDISTWGQIIDQVLKEAN